MRHMRENEMKKILLASSILVGTAGFAAANDNIAISGDAFFGMAYNGTTWNAIYGAGIDFAMTGETDNGLMFGAKVGFDANDSTVNDTSVWVSGDFGKLAIGDVSNAIDDTVGGIAIVGLGEDAPGPETNDVDDDAERYKGTSAADVLYTGTFGKFGVAASYATGNGDYAIAGKYTFGDYNVAAGFENDGGVNGYAISGGATFGNFGVNVLYAAQPTPNNTSYGLDASYTTGAVTITGVVGQHSVGGVSQVMDYGLGVAYDLGGGATVKAGVANVDGNNVADFGISMKF